MSFAEFWSKYPPVGVSERRTGKKAAEKAYNRARKEFSHEAIMACLALMLETDWKHRKPEFLPHAATWLNRECFDDDRCELLEDEHENGRHLCDVCAVAHEWHEGGDPVQWSPQRVLACPDAQQAMKKAINSGLQRAAALKGF